MKYFVLVIALAFAANAIVLNAQADKVRSYVKLVADGKIAEAKWGYKQISKEHPNDPGVIFLGGILELDATDAVKAYNKVITEFPKSEWADDAYWRLIQYHIVMNEYAKAKQELGTFKAKYPASEFLAPTLDLVRVAAIAAGDKEEPTEKKDAETKKEPENKKGPVIKKEPLPKMEPDTKTITKVKPEPKELVTAKEPADAEIKWGLQAGLYSSNKTAQAEMNKYKKKRMDARIVTKEVDDNTMYAVIIGTYKTKKDAEEARSFVNGECHCNPLIVKY